MSDPEYTITQLAAELRSYSPDAVSSEPAGLKPLVQGFLNFLEKTPPEETRQAAPKADTVLSLNRILQKSQDPSTIKSCLRAMLRAGRFGRILSARFVHGKSIPMRKLAAILTSLPARDRLALSHEMLLDKSIQRDKQTREWLEGLINSLAAVQPEELTPFVAELGRCGETLAFPAKQVIISGLFGEWLSTTLKTGTSGDAMEDLCYMVWALDDPEHAHTLAVSISVGFITATPLALRTVGHLAEAGTKPVLDMFLKVLKTSDKSLAGPCLDGIIAQYSPASGKLLATLRLKMPSLAKAANTRVPLLGEKAHISYLSSLPKDKREKAEADAFSALLAIAPDFVESLTRTGVAPTAEPPPEPTNGNGNGAINTGTSCHKPGFLTRILGRAPKTLEKVLPKARNVRDMELICSKVADTEIDGREFIGLNLSGSSFSDVKFVRAKLANSKLVNSMFSGGEHIGGTFNNNDFSGTDFSDVVFSKCSFNDCDFTGAAFSNCKFHECRFRGCTLSGAAFISGTMIKVGFSVSVLSGVTFFEIHVTSSRFDEVEFTNASFESAEFQGVEFSDSVLLGASLTRTTFHAVDMPGSTVHNCRILHSDLPHSLFLTNRVRQFSTQASKAESEPLPDPNIAPPGAAGKVLRAWAREMTFFRREERMQAYNRARLSRAINAFELNQQIYIRILPYLLGTDVFENKFDIQGVPSCSVWGYTPGLTTLELASQYFPEHKPNRAKATVNIVAVYAMGSLGSVAQTAKSDIDAWVCYDGDLTMQEEAGLKRKLDALGLWAESEFGMEAHFFPMRMDDVRANIFSSGDEESSGSAQALLLKEEFYRTALRIAGKHIAWWVTPAGTDKATYDKYMQAARRYPLTGRPRLEDFGHLAPVPADEYFGGSLWQMVKAVHSPFKSVLKLGLLETYADPKTSPIPLCDRIKHNLFMRRRGVKRTDPYATLFSTLRGYYAKRGDKKAAGLLTESFKFKANLCDIPFFMNLPARPEDASLIEALFGKAYTDPDKICSADTPWTFDKSLRMGSAVREYMVNTYQRIQGALRQNGSTDALINAEDLTRMGRRIGANFSKKPNKIMRVPFMDTKGDGFPILHLSAQKAPGKKPIWIARGGSRSEAKKSADSLQLLHRSGDAVIMLTWLLANRIYNPRSLLQADRTIAPLSVADLQKLMPAMYEFFPFDETFERDINEGLDAERVTRVFMIFNLITATEAKKIETVSCVYTTNWGEMFCKTFRNPGKEFEEFPSKYLAKHLDQPVIDAPQMLLFIPKGSQCKRINLI
ncbi:class I adenylate cyclase [Pseudodesulfovibrio sp. zrk46]|uniref:class I adenylate cyclase n=1 Tax=Pseudodesulfovibrio sp. zrk46 TaxID=2725288 RepID=UPI001448F949|nr:class I adenylate cyclase [Pseudodesulfovibrio sp. zrk46]QJB55016.1 adenylate cyclase [Pseudodesulfovibrio sp. zrk46]